jgi:hypothetical protein
LESFYPGVRKRDDFKSGNRHCEAAKPPKQSSAREKDRIASLAPAMTAAAIQLHLIPF